jgi:hypothetical protein
MRVTNLKFKSFTGKVKSPLAASPARHEIRAMNNIVGLAILALGIVLLVFGLKESHSFSSDVSRFFTGNPTDRSMWMIVGGVVTVIAGLFLAITGMRKR